MIESVAQKEKYEGLKSKAGDKIRSLERDIEAISSGKFHWKTVFTKNKEGEITNIERQIGEVNLEKIFFESNIAVIVEKRC